MAGTSTLSLNTVAGISVGDALQLQLDNGVLFNAQVTGVSTAGNTVTLASNVTSQATAGNSVTDRTNPFSAVNTTSSSATGGSNVVTYFAALANNQIAGDTSLQLTTVGGMAVGDQVMIALDSGATFTTTINAINTATSTITTGLGLPSAASAGNTISDNVTTLPTSTTGFTPSALMVAIFTLQLDNLITGANPTINVTQLQKDVAALSKANLTALQFQAALTTLNTLWQTGASSHFSVTA